MSGAFWNRKLTSAERTEYYNSGNGLQYDDLSAVASIAPAPYILQQ
jgi:hypothetical protein